MKKIMFILFGILAMYRGNSQAPCYCNLVTDFMLAKDSYDPKTEMLQTVPEGKELWIKMKPAHQRNRGERGGCRLVAGERYVTDKNLKILRAAECGNPIVHYEWIQTYKPPESSPDLLESDLEIPRAPVVLGNESRTNRKPDYQQTSRAPVPGPVLIPKSPPQEQNRQVSDLTAGYRIKFYEEKQSWFSQDGNFFGRSVTKGAATLGYVGVAVAAIGGALLLDRHFDNQNNTNNSSNNTPTTNGYDPGRPQNGYNPGSTGMIAPENPGCINVKFSLSF
jgi:hypothetical protein